MVLEKTLESPSGCKEINPVNPKGDQFWIFIGRTEAEVEAPMLWPPDAKNWFIWKDPDARKDWRQEEKGVREDEIIGWHHQLNGHEFEQALGDGEGKLACCSPWIHKELDVTERLSHIHTLQYHLSLPWLQPWLTSDCSLIRDPKTKLLSSTSTLLLLRLWITSICCFKLLCLGGW